MHNRKRDRVYTAMAILLREKTASLGLDQDFIAKQIGITPGALSVYKNQHYTGHGVTRPGFGSGVEARAALALKCKKSEIEAAAELSKTRFTVPNLSPAHAACGVALEAAWESMTAEDLAKIEGVAAYRGGK